MPCIPLHRETSKCTLVYIEMYPGKVVVLLKEQATIIKASMALMSMRSPSVCFIQAQTEIECGNKLMLMLLQKALK